MRRLLSLVLAALLALSIVGAVAEDNDEIVITYGKNFDYDGKTFIHDQTLENNYYTQYVKEKHNVRVEYAWVLDDDSQKDALAVVSGEMPDVMYVNQSVFDMLIEADMLQPITKAFAENANQYLREACESYPEAYAAATVKGELMAIPCATVKKQHQVVWVRQDWLDKLGLEVPTTADEFIDTLIAFREQDANGDGIQNEKALFATDMSLLKHCGICGWYGLIMNNIGLDPNTDKVTSVFYQEGFKPYVEFVQKMVNAGVLSLADNGSLYTTDTQSIIAQNTVGAMYYQTKLLDTRDELTGDENCKYVPISIQGVDDIFPTCRGDYALTVYNGYYAFMNTVDKEAAAKLLDFCFTPEYWRWNRDGIEGRDWEYDENGNVTSLTPGMTADEMIAAGLGSGRFYMDRAVMPTLDISRTYATYNGEKIGTFESVEALKDSAYGKNVLAKAEKNDKKADGRMVERNLLNWEQLEQKNATMFQTNVNTYLALPTDDEVKTLAEYESELKTAMNELFVNLIRGDKDIEKLDEYLDELRAMGLDEVIGVYQSRYDRFCGR